MPTVTCPSCGERGRIPGHFVGTRIKCKKCGVAFLVTGAAAKTAAPAAGNLGPGAREPNPFEAHSGPPHAGIVVEGLNEAEWSSTTAVATPEPDHDHDHPHDEATSAFTASHPDTPTPQAGPGTAGGPVKQYKVLSPRDKVFEGKFSLELLESVLNTYARQGWVVRGMATPLVAGFGGGEREMLVVLLER
jgi:hypothetical protein